MTATMTAAQRTAFAALTAYATALPEAWIDHPWGHTAVKVKKKMFCILSSGDEADATHAVSVTVKLPVSAGQALALPFASPTGYGLGRAGWVSLRFDGADPVPVDILTPWIRESYISLAPKTLAARLAAAPASTKKPSTKKSSTKKPLTKKPPTKKSPGKTRADLV